MAEQVTITAVRKAARACKVASASRKLADEKDAEKTIAMMAVFEPLLGIKSELALKDMSLQAVQRSIRRRVEAGEVKLRGISLNQLIDDCIELSQARRYVSWKDCFVDELGEGKAAQRLEDTPESFSYRIVAP